MRRIILGAVSAAALLVAGAGAAQAQGFFYDGPDYYAPGVGVQVGPVQGWVGAPAGLSAAPEYGYYGDPYNSWAPRGGTYKMNAFRSQELMPQSPPGGGY